MELQNYYYHRRFPLPLNPAKTTGENAYSGDRQETKPVRVENSATINGDVDFPILASAADLREAVKFLKHKPNGVSVAEIMNAEPRRVFDARKIAAYEFWGVFERSHERLRLTDLGWELAKGTEVECAVSRQIIRSIPAYFNAVAWIYQQKLSLATYRDVSEFWRKSPVGIELSDFSQDNIEAVIVSFFSLCHAAEIGTATLGKRGQPARLNVNLKQIDALLNSTVEIRDFGSRLPKTDRDRSAAPKPGPGSVERVLIAGGESTSAIDNLSAALELADFANIIDDPKPLRHGLLPSTRIESMKQCQAAIFILGEKDCAKRDGRSVLSCERIAEISVGRALFGERIVILWQSGKSLPDCVQQSGIDCFVSERLDWEMIMKLVKHLKGQSIQAS